MKAPSMVARNAIYKELQYDVFSSIVTEAVLRAVPLDKDELAGYAKDLRGYTRNSLVNMDALNMVKEAMETVTEPAKSAYLYNLYDALTDVPWEAATRIANESAGVKDLPEAIGDRGFTEGEMKRLTSKVDSLTVPALAKVINRKVTAVLKDEKNAYEQEQLLQKELADTVKKNNEEVASKLKDDEFEQPVNGNFGDENDSEGQTKDSGKDGEPPVGKGDQNVEPETFEDDETLESYMNLILEKKDARHHISVFSRLQDLAMETILTSGVKVENELPIPVLETMIQNTVLPCYAPESTIEHDFDVLTMAMEAVEAPATDDAAKIAHICTIVVYTLLEALKTMNVCSPSTQSVKDFINAKPCVTTPGDTANHLCDSIAKNVQNIQRRMNVMSPHDVGIAFDSCVNLKERIENMSEKYPELQKNLPTLEAMIESLRKKISSQTKLPATESLFETRMRKDNISQFSKLMSVWGKRPDVREIMFTPETATEGTCVSVDIKGGNGVQLGHSNLFLNRSEKFGSLEDIVTECINASELMHSDKLLSLYEPRTGRSTILKERF